ncbi:MAG TPA: CHAT domain-containing protein [Saprospiraceae bacterium]|nr:CHAT domain-containing protein [Saprospiraceae bacterium]MCB9268772.1 CHAT domain-containing protein [Lewinellaceae bacterium]HPG05640.1 CHAT domain-containing protein [Saprospiraceae bacterium]HPQ99991.1 CHAT domain-containing protein [Saprospiraceae bacterium]HQU52110.1 CHAT domain-containing protein [Saprospiraceae bacterium]
MDRTQIENLLANDRLEEVLTLVKNFADKQQDQYLENDAIMLLGRLNSARRDQNMGFVTREQAQITLNQIRNSVLSFVDQCLKSQITMDTILFLGASPKDLAVLRTNEEIQRIQDGIRAATFRDRLNFVSEPAVQISTITNAMQRYQPSIVHFSGHGAGQEGIAVEDANGEEVLFPNAGLDRLFGLFKEQVKCVLLNACYSNVQAEIISRHGIYVIGMDNAVGDDAAIHFSIGFYQSIGEGKDYPFAFDVGCVNGSPYLGTVNPEMWFEGNKIKV